MIETIKEDKELELLLQGIFKYYGYDFRGYSRPGIYRRIRIFLSSHEISSPLKLLSMISSDHKLFESLVYSISVTVTEMFRDSDVYRIIRSILITYLKTYLILKIWHAGCATGEEVYSMAILLMETGLYARSIIYATDFNERALSIAKQGIFSLINLKKHLENYQISGGRCSFSDYYLSDNNSLVFNVELKKNIVF